MNAAAEPPPARLAETMPPGEVAWTRSRWVMLITLVFAAHVLLVFTFGGRKQIVPRPVTGVPTLQLAEGASEWLALNDPTLFALPHEEDFASAVWRQTPATNQPFFRWIGPTNQLSLPANELGTAFDQFLRTNRFASFELQLKPPPKFSAPALPAASALAQTSTLQLKDGLAQRRLLNEIKLPSWPYADVIAPSRVQVLVDPAGDVVSAVLLPPAGGFTTAGRYDKADQLGPADQRALEIARGARFTPASSLTVGRMIFNWHTVPLTNSNEHE